MVCESAKVLGSIIEHLSEMGNAYAQFKLEDREQARNLRDRLVKSKFVMCMHLMNDILQVVGEVSVQMQDPVCTILDIPGFYETLRTLIFAVKQCTTPKIAQFMEEYDPVQQAWNNVKLKSAVPSSRKYCAGKI